MAATELIIAGATTILVQGLQAWLATCRMAGMSEEQIQQLFDQQFASFKLKPANQLPDPK